MLDTVRRAPPRPASRDQSRSVEISQDPPAKISRDQLRSFDSRNVAGTPVLGQASTTYAFETETRNHRPARPQSKSAAVRLASFSPASSDQPLDTPHTLSQT